MGGPRLTILFAVACVLVSACSSTSTTPDQQDNPGSTSTQQPVTSSTKPPVTSPPEWVRPSITVSGDESAVQPGESIQEAVNAAEKGDVIEIAAGMHRMQSIEPKTGQTIRGAPGAILSGAMLLTDFVEEDGVWEQADIGFEGEQAGSCATEGSTCTLPEDLFFDGERLLRVASRDDVGADSWYLDYDSDTLFLGRDPTGAEVELSALPLAFGGEATDVTIEGLVIEKYASPAQRGAIDVGKGWTIAGNEIRLNHGAALYPGSDTLVTDNFLHDNGQMAIDGGGNDSTYERNEIAYNNTGGFSFEWGAGGVKFVHTENLVLRDNYVHDNHGPGLWIDGYNVNTLFEGNRVVNNFDAGIKIEISGSATVRDNTVAGNGFGNAFPPRGAGIMIRESGPVEVVGNDLRGNKEAVILHQDNGRENETGNTLHSISVHDNKISLDGGLVGYFGDIPFDAFESADLVFEDNSYTGTPGEESFLDHGDTVTFEQWQDSGRDAGSSFVGS
jgi:parallel beta-helix repeat protein